MDSYTISSTAAHSQVTADNVTPRTLAERGARGVFLTVATNPCYVTFDGSTPSATNGLLIPAATAPVFFPISPRYDIKCLSTAAGGSTVNALWVW